MNMQLAMVAGQLPGALIEKPLGTAAAAVEAVAPTAATATTGLCVSEDELLPADEAAGARPAAAAEAGAGRASPDDK